MCYLKNKLTKLLKWFGLGDDTDEPWDTPISYEKKYDDTSWYIDADGNTKGRESVTQPEEPQIQPKTRMERRSHQTTSTNIELPKRKPMSWATIVLASIAIGIIVVVALVAVVWGGLPKPTPQVTPTATSVESSESFDSSESNSESSHATHHSSTKESESSSEPHSESSDSSTDTSDGSGPYLATVMTDSGDQTQRFADLATAEAWCRQKIDEGTAFNYTVIYQPE